MCDCGFNYIRTGPDSTPEDRYKRGRIENFGPLWLKVAKEVELNGDLSLRKKARLLGVDPKTFQEKVLLDAEIDKSKEKQEPNITCNVEPEFITVKINTTKVRVDWGQRDKELSERVFNSIKCIIEQATPVRITKSELVRSAELPSSIIYTPDKLPLTSKMINQYIESTEDFQKRRINWAMRILRERNELVEWKIRRLAGITNRCSNKVQLYIKSCLNTYDGWFGNE